MRRGLSAPQLLATSFAGFILLGTVLLSLPFASENGAALPLIDAFFTATSAVCVTGLIVVDTPRQFTFFGEAVVLLLVQAGGLGYMTISTVVAVALGKRVTLQERLALREAMNVQTLDGVLRFAGTVFLMTLAFEVAAAAVLAWRWVPEHGAAQGAWLGLFHAVSGFNNAGVSLFSANLVPYRDDVVVIGVISLLVITGGLGFVVLSEIARLRAGVRLSVHTRLVLVVTGILIVGGTVAVYLLERHNPRTLGGLGPGAAWLAAYFQAVMPRTAGFNSLDIGALHPPTLFLIMALMFIGGGPGGTAGGVKVSTFGITVVALWATVRGHTEAVVFRRRLPPELVGRAFFISLISFLALNVVTGLVLVAEGRDLLPTLFETTSAFGTVGLSMGQSGSPLSLSGFFSPAGKLLIAFMMFIGRVGPLTLAVAVAGGRPHPHLRYPEGKVLVG